MRKVGAESSAEWDGANCNLSLGTRRPLAQKVGKIAMNTVVSVNTMQVGWRATWKKANVLRGDGLSYLRLRRRSHDIKSGQCRRRVRLS